MCLSCLNRIWKINWINSSFYDVKTLVVTEYGKYLNS